MTLDLSYIVVCCLIYVCVGYQVELGCVCVGGRVLLGNIERWDKQVFHDF